MCAANRPPTKPAVILQGAAVHDGGIISKKNITSHMGGTHGKHNLIM